MDLLLSPIKPCCSPFDRTPSAASTLFHWGEEPLLPSQLCSSSISSFKMETDADCEFAELCGAINTANTTDLTQLESRSSASSSAMSLMPPLDSRKKATTPSLPAPFAAADNKAPQLMAVTDLNKNDHINNNDDDRTWRLKNPVGTTPDFSVADISVQLRTRDDASKPNTVDAVLYSSLVYHLEYTLVLSPLPPSASGQMPAGLIFAHLQLVDALSSQEICSSHDGKPVLSGDNPVICCCSSAKTSTSTTTSPEDLHLLNNTSNVSSNTTGCTLIGRSKIKITSLSRQSRWMLKLSLFDETHTLHPVVLLSAPFHVRARRYHPRQHDNFHVCHNQHGGNTNKKKRKAAYLTAEKTTPPLPPPHPDTNHDDDSSPASSSSSSSSLVAAPSQIANTSTHYFIEGLDEIIAFLPQLSEPERLRAITMLCSKLIDETLVQ